MPSTINLKRQIKSIRNTSQITKAMELVSASKLKKSTEYAFKSRAYYDLANEMLYRISQKQEVESLPLFEKRKIKSKLYIIITSNSGLAGAYNSNVIKLLMGQLIEDQSSGINPKIIVVGSRGAQFVRHLDVELVAYYPEFKDQPTANQIRPLLQTVIDQYNSKKVDQVILISTKYKSSISQVANNFELLPVSQPEQNQESFKPLTVSTFEPDLETVIEQISTRLIEAQIWQAILESMASEHAMRMLAMKNASDNAKDLIEDYTLELNGLRQASITQELAEISAGVEALKEE